MTNEFITSASKVFLERHPRYVICPENSKIMTKEILRLVDEEGYDPAEIRTYDTAFSNCWEQLNLLPETPPKSPEELSNEEIVALSPRERDRLPDAVLRRFANYELQQRRKKTPRFEGEELLAPLFEAHGFALSGKNVSIVNHWLNIRNLACSESNIASAFNACESQLEASESVIADMGADEYRKAVLDPMLRTQPKKETRRPELPLGVKYTEWIHSR